MPVSWVSGQGEGDIWAKTSLGWDQQEGLLQVPPVIRTGTGMWTSLG